MKHLLIILFVIICQDTFSQDLKGEHLLRFETGDFIVWSHGPWEDPRTFSVNRECEEQALFALVDTLNQYNDLYLVTMIDPSREDLFSIREESGTIYVQAIQDVYGGQNFAHNKESDMQPVYRDGKLHYAGGAYLKIPTPWYPHMKNVMIQSHRRVIVIFTRNPNVKNL